MHFIHTIAEVSVLATSSAKYLAIHDAIVADYLILTLFIALSNEGFSLSEMCVDYDTCSKEVKSDNLSKRVQLS